DQAAEMKEWVARAQHIADRVSKIEGVTAAVRGGGTQGAGGRSNRSAGVTVTWDTARIGITGQEVTNLLYTTEPRIATGGGGGGGGRRGQAGGSQTSISFNVSMIAPGDEKIVADRMVQVLSAGHEPKAAEALKSPAIALGGRWDVEIEFTASKTTHTLY